MNSISARSANSEKRTYEGKGNENEDGKVLCTAKLPLKGHRI